MANIWPMLLIVTTMAITIRVAMIIINKEEVHFYRELLMLMFIVYVMCLFYVVTFQDVSWSTSNFIPFKEMFRYAIFSRPFFINILGNMLMFLPYGFFLAYYLKTNKLIVPLVLSLITSVTIESTQLLIGRVFDVDDIILNVVGTIVGFYLYRLFKKFKSHLPKLFQTERCYNVVTMMVFIVLVIYIINILWRA